MLAADAMPPYSMPVAIVGEHVIRRWQDRSATPDATIVFPGKTPWEHDA
jgi:hypothetical protein